jgi:hypothetical protein
VDALALTKIIDLIQAQITAIYWVLALFFLLITGAFGYTLYASSALWAQLAKLARWKEEDERGE